MQKKIKLLIHICCAVDAVYSLDFIKNSFKSFSVTAFFYNPNIVPEREYELRVLEAKRAARINNVEIVMGEYDNQLWQNHCSCLYFEPEKGERCRKCHEILINKTAQYAKHNDFDYFSTTLFMSPKKDYALLEESCRNAETLYNIKFLKSDMRKNNGYLKTRELVKKHSVYSQQYCGCSSSYTLRDNWMPNRVFISGITNNPYVLPASVEAQNILYYLRNFLEEKGIEVKTKFFKTLFWNIKRFSVKINGTIINYPQVVLAGMSCSKKGVFRTRVKNISNNGFIETEKDDVEFYLNNFNNVSLKNTTAKVIFFGNLNIKIEDIIEVKIETDINACADSIAIFSGENSGEINQKSRDVTLNIYDYPGFTLKGYTKESAVKKIEDYIQEIKNGKICINISSYLPI